MLAGSNLYARRRLWCHGLVATTSSGSLRHKKARTQFLSSGEALIVWSSFSRCSLEFEASSFQQRSPAKNQSGEMQFQCESRNCELAPQKGPVCDFTLINTMFNEPFSSNIDPSRVMSRKSWKVIWMIGRKLRAAKPGKHKHTNTNTQSWRQMITRKDQRPGNWE